MELCQLVNCEGCTRGEIGLLLHAGIVRSELRIGRVARLLRSTHVGKEAASCIEQDVLPLPASPPEAFVLSLMAALRGGATLADIRKDFGRTVLIAARHAWHLLLVLLVNTMSLGWSLRANTSWIRLHVS